MNIYNKITQIIEAWVISFNPTQEQKELATKRLKICFNCISIKTIAKTNICSECGCPISKKGFTNEYNPCPLKKWGEIDEPYFKIKKEKTLI